MAAITQRRHGLFGRRYGSFADKTGTVVEPECWRRITMNRPRLEVTVNKPRLEITINSDCSIEE